jgi:hypothetical protein
MDRKERTGAPTECCVQSEAKADDTLARRLLVVEGERGDIAQRARPLPDECRRRLPGAPSAVAASVIAPVTDTRPGRLPRRAARSFSLRRAAFREFGRFCCFRGLR